MKEKLNQVNQTIEEKRNRLKEKAERYFAAIQLPSNAMPKECDGGNKTRSVPPISYILYGIAGLSAWGMICSHSKFLCLGLTVASAFGGYKLSKRTDSEVTSIPVQSSSDINVESLKSEVVSKVLDSVKKITQEWEEFMELKQREVQSAISSSSLGDGEKDSMSSKIFIYEVVDISISEFSSMINSVSNQSDIKIQLDLYRSKFLSAIDAAAMRQMSIYNSLI